MATARGLFSVLAAMRAPCSVKARGRTGENLSRRRRSQFVTTSFFSSGLSTNVKSSGNRSAFRLTAWLSALVATPYRSARSASRMILWPRMARMRLSRTGAVHQLGAGLLLVRALHGGQLNSTQFHPTFEGGFNTLGRLDLFKVSVPDVQGRGWRWPGARPGRRGARR